MDGDDLNYKVLLTICCTDARQSSWTMYGGVIIHWAYSWSCIVYCLSFWGVRLCECMAYFCNPYFVDVSLNSSTCY